MKLFSLTKTLFLTLFASAMLSSAALAFTELDGTPTSIKEQAGDGKWTIVKIWASDCHWCRVYMPDLVELDGQMDNARIVGISLDGQPGIDETQKTIKEFGIPFKTVMSNSVEIYNWLVENANEEFRGTPTYMVLDPEGKIVGLNPGIIREISTLKKFIEDRQ